MASRYRESAMDNHAYHARLQNWQTDYDDFATLFVRRAHILANSVGYEIRPNHERLKTAHAAWAAACKHWKEEKIDPQSHDLSQIKVLGLLLHHFVSTDWCPDLFEGGTGAPESTRWKGKEHIKEYVRKCIANGRGQYLTFQFVIQMINWFETYREDRTDEFKFRLTPNLEHDLMVYFASDKQDELSTFLILQALYARPAPRR
jgi:hypothetical protein